LYNEVTSRLGELSRASKKGDEKMKNRKLSLLVVIMVILAVFVAPLGALGAPATGSTLLKNVQVTGVTEDGGTFTGKLTITEFAYDAAEGLLVSGDLKGQVTDAAGNKTNVNESFTDVAATLLEQGDNQNACQILFLDIGPIFLDILGLQLDISQIVIDLTAVPGPGNLLGNLLCAVAGLLDGDGFLTGLLDDLLGFLEDLNDLL
jgi:hypothetical protein